jgi:hypothetical protein
MNKYSGRESLVVNKRQECDARTDAGANQPDFLIATLKEPVGSASSIGNRLPGSRESSPDIRGNEILRSLEVGWFSLVVIRHTEPECANACML